MGKIKINRVFAASMGYMIGGVLIKGIAFITTPIFSRLLTTQEFGVLNTYLSYEAILAMLVGFQFASSFKTAKIEFSSNENGLNAYFSRIVSLLLIHSGIAIVLINIFSEFVIRVTGIDSVLLLNFLVINCLGNSLVAIYNSYVSLNYQYKKYIKIAIFNAILNVGISLVLIKTIMSNERSLARIFGYVIPYVIISIYIIVFAYRQAKPNLFSKDGYSKFAYRYCTPLIPAGFAEVMLGQFGKLTVEKNCGYHTMGVYSLSYNVYSIIGIIRISMDYIVGPFFFDKRKSGEIESLQKIVKVYSRMLAIISILIMLFSSEIVRILGDVDYFEARKSAIPLVAASYFVFLCSTISQEEYYQKKTFLVSVVSVVTMIINIIVCILVVPLYGAVGAAFCTMISYIVMLLLHALIIKFYMKSNTFRWINIIIDCAVVTIMSVVSLLLIDKLLIRILVITAVVIFAVIYGIKTAKTIKEGKK